MKNTTWEESLRKLLSKYSAEYSFYREENGSGQDVGHAEEEIITFIRLELERERREAIEECMLAISEHDKSWWFDANTLLKSLLLK